MGWPRNSYTGYGEGSCPARSGMYKARQRCILPGPGGGASAGRLEAVCIPGQGGGLSTGPGGGLSTGPGGGLSTGPGGGLSTGPGGGLYTGPGGGLYAGPSPYYSNIPPRHLYLEELKRRGLMQYYDLLKRAWRL
ncbi:MAG: hypothetical protein U5K77_02490 [Candidatus Saccharibacteria bacterium]|nr:hypothetical protein [Candidatus Saccharibacteria bacterium]